MQETVYSGIFYYLGEFRELEVLVRDGRIERVGMDIRGFPVKRLPPGAVLPAGTDIHVHFRDPGETEKEDFETGSLSAIYGGTTTVFDMPNNAVPVDNYEVFREKLARVRGGRSYADFGLYTMFTGSNEEVISRETSGIKVFMGGSTNSVVVPEIDERKARPWTHSTCLWPSMRRTRGGAWRHTRWRQGTRGNTTGPGHWSVRWRLGRQ